MTEQCGWQDKRGNDCARPAVWTLTDEQSRDSVLLSNDDPVYSCNVHLADVVRERAVEWVGCWVDKA